MVRGEDELRRRRESKDPVEHMLRSKDLTERLKAVDILRERGELDRLYPLLYAESWHLREKVARDIASFGEVVKEEILPLLEEGYWYVRASACYILGEVGDEEIFKTIKKHLYESNETVKSEAAKAMAKIAIRDRTLWNSLEVEERLTLENILKANKEFDLIENLKTYDKST